MLKRRGRADDTFNVQVVRPCACGDKMTVTIVKGIASRIDQQSSSAQTKSIRSLGQSVAVAANATQVAAGDAAVVRLSRSSELSGDKIREPGKAKQVAEDIAERVREQEGVDAHNLDSANPGVALSAS